jgi:hypothetical protein
MPKITNLPANSWKRPVEDRNMPGEYAGPALNAAATSGDDSSPIPSNVLNTLMQELEHSQALTRRLLKQLVAK